MNNLDVVKKILSFSPRQLANEQKTARFIKSFLRSQKINFTVQSFFTKAPKIKKAFLNIDGESIPCEGAGFISGKILKPNLLNSLESSQLHLYEPNINFNPKCESISLSNFYFAPSLAISVQDKEKLKKTKKIRAEIKVGPIQYRSQNILAGNFSNPSNIIFGHYDSIKTGATDNASGVAVMLNLVLENPRLLEKSLFVFCGNEELSYDQPIYWGHGYRVFEKEYLHLFKKTLKIFVVDCVGNGKTKIYLDPKIIQKAFPIENVSKFRKKIYIIDGDIDKLTKVYHSDDDDINQLDERWLVDAAEFLSTKLS